METDKQTPELNQPELPSPYIKPAVERIPLTEAKAGPGTTASADLVSPFSS
jgi:hypothetical protein